VISIDILPDDVLLAVFDIILGEHGNVDRILDLWQPLVHVCRRWRSIVFGSPGHLNLRLRCTARKPVRDMLDIWPPFPLIIYGGTSKTEAYDNVIAALERRDRVHEISLIMTNSPAHEKVLAAMQEPFPELTELQVSLYGEPELIIPDSFLGGSAPRLEVLELEGIPFPGLPNLLLSATNLYYLKLLNIPHSGYISPDAVVTAISTLTSLRSLILEFQPPRSHPYHASRRLPPKTRTVLPVLTFFWFKGVHEYLDDLVAHIDAPRLHDLTITFFNDIVFDTPQFTQFINRTPKFESRKSVQVVIEDDAAEVKFSSHPSDDELLEVGISCRELDWQISFLEQACTWYLPPLSTTEDLYMYEHLYKQKLDWQDENMLWLELLHQFNTVKNLYLSKKFRPRIVAALQDLVGSRTTEVLPILQNIFLEELEPAGHAQEDIRRFVAARQLSGHTITVSHWERDRRLYS
jgi:hypothetical protein